MARSLFFLILYTVITDPVLIERDVGVTGIHYAENTDLVFHILFITKILQM